MRWSIDQRLEFIEFRLYWAGRINRRDLVSFFGISVPQASADLNRYVSAAKGNTTYDRAAKAYVVGPRFRPLFGAPSADRYLAQLRLIAAGILPEQESWIALVPPFSAIPTPRRRVESETLRRVLDAMRTHQSLEICYQSMSRPRATWRWIAPHALAFDGSRWHVRSWCEAHLDFRDFVLARILEIRSTRPAGFDPAHDLEWHRQVRLKIGPHPALRAGRRRAVELDYGMVNGVATVATRVSLSYYVERHLGLDLAPTQVPPERQQLVLLNRDEVEAARTHARAAARFAQGPGAEG